jgi:hypothetical protein
MGSGARSAGPGAVFEELEFFELGAELLLIFEEL